MDLRKTACNGRMGGDMGYSLARKATVVLTLVGLIAAAASTTYAQDDWEAVGHETSESPKPGRASGSTPSATGNPNAAQGGFYACGEEARPAAAGVKTMVARINDLWGSNVQVYESVAPVVPHAMPGGCIFYNPRVLGALMAGRLDVRDPDAVAPLIWAIFAHEIGHEDHHDFDRARFHTPSEVKELEADRFAGYTLEKLNIPATGLAPYWAMAGDEFGAHAKHGSSEQRVAAFKEGWHLAEWNRPEDSQSALTAAQQEQVAPDDVDSAP
jgi:hypothetical protein